MAIQRKNNFDFLRVSLAIFVAFYHLVILTQSTYIFDYISYHIAEFAVDSFFVISGFLIFMSYEHSHSLWHYYSKRAKRILPGYISVILISSVLLYFFSIKVNFFDYFNLDYIKYLLANLSTLNFLHPTLPGLFENHFTSAVNGALWTIKVEIIFYLSLPFLVYVIKKFKIALSLCILYIFSILYVYLMLYLYHKSGSDIYLTLEKQFPGQLAFFIAGAVLHYYYSLFLKYKTLLFIGVIITLYLHFNIISLYFFYPISLAVFIIYIANIFPFLGNFSKYGDFSFGIYIWHFPIIQTLISLHLFDEPIIGILLFVLLTCIAGFCSWHCVEKRFLYQQ